MTGRRIAAFDFDGTISRRDTLVPFLARACGTQALTRALRRIGPLALKARTGRLDAEVHHRDATKAALLAELMTGRAATWLDHQGERYAAGLPSRLRPEMVEQIHW